MKQSIKTKIQHGTMIWASATCLLAFVGQAAPSYYASTGHYYEYVSVPGNITWSNALGAAAARTYLGLAGHLAAVTSAGENAFLVSLGIPAGGAWLGGVQLPPNTPTPDANWGWITGEPWGYANWAPGEPNDNVGLQEFELSIGGTNGALGYWNDQSAGDEIEGYLVEYEPGFYSGTGHYYEYVSVPGNITWSNALAAAAARTYRGMAGHLGTVTSAGENAFLVSLGIPAGGAWLGGVQSPPNTPIPDANWGWITGEPWGYANWGPGEPNDNMGLQEFELSIGGTNGALGYWNDQSAGDEIEGYLVEYEPPKLTIAVSQVRLCWTSATNTVYQVQYRTELTPNVWVNLGAPVVGSGTNGCITDEIVTPQRFYQLVVLP